MVETGRSALKNGSPTLWFVTDFSAMGSPARLAMAAKLFETGKLTSGQAARLVGMARVAFLGQLGRLGVSAIQVQPDELEQDLATAEAAACDHPE